MIFSKHIKKLKLIHIESKVINLGNVKCQYNPDKYKHWIKVCGDSFTVQSSPFYHFLNAKNTQRYFDLFRLYGRSDVWVSNNILKFQGMYDDILANGFDSKKSLPIVLENPIIKNKYNSGYEIYEGHRRITICQYLNINQEVDLCRYQIT